MKSTSWLYFLILAAVIVAAAVYLIYRYLEFSNEQQEIYKRLRKGGNLPGIVVFCDRQIHFR